MGTEQTGAVTPPRPRRTPMLAWLASGWLSSWCAARASGEGADSYPRHRPRRDGKAFIHMYTYIFIYVYTNREKNRDNNGEREQDESGRQPSRVRKGIRMDGSRTDQNRGYPYPPRDEGREGKERIKGRQGKKGSTIRACIILPFSHRASDHSGCNFGIRGSTNHRMTQNVTGGGIRHCNADILDFGSRGYGF